jgi:hypothetical protein
MNYSFLLVKNPNNQATKEELCRIVYHLMDIIGFSKIDVMWYETGKQNQQHIHAIIRKRMPCQEDIEKMSITFKIKKMKWFEYGKELLFEKMGSVIVHKRDTKDFNWKISEIKDKEHYLRIKWEYRFKELNPEFIDDE